MYNHAPEGYACPFCRIVQHAAPSDPACDVIFQTGAVTAFLGLGRWERTPLDVLVVPNAHIENLYDLPLALAPDLQAATRAVAIALKAVCRCDGVSSRQHNEPSGGQDVWHYHVHVTPRYHNDDFYRSRQLAFVEAERLQHTRALRQHFSTHPDTLRD